jgi:hypothetical protein
MKGKRWRAKLVRWAVEAGPVACIVLGILAWMWG